MNRFGRTWGRKKQEKVAFRALRLPHRSRLLLLLLLQQHLLLLLFFSAPIPLQRKAAAYKTGSFARSQMAIPALSLTKCQTVEFCRETGLCVSAFGTLFGVGWETKTKNRKQPPPPPRPLFTTPNRSRRKPVARPKLLDLGRWFAQSFTDWRSIERSGERAWPRLLFGCNPLLQLVNTCCGGTIPGKTIDVMWIPDSQYSGVSFIHPPADESWTTCLGL